LHHAFGFGDGHGACAGGALGVGRGGGAAHGGFYCLSRRSEPMDLVFLSWCKS
jgi:hypothetical protein